MSKTVTGKLDDKEITEAFGRANIPKMFRHKDTSLLKFGANGKLLQQWVTSPSFVEDIGSGQNRFFVTNSDYGMDIWFVLARAILLSGLSVKIVNLLDLLKGRGDEEFRETINDIQTLFIAGFYVDGPKGSGSPMDDEARYWLEWFVSMRIRNRQSTFFQSTRELQVCDWYSPSFLKLIKEHSTTLHI